jgi:hypothetical protein
MSDAQSELRDDLNASAAVSPNPAATDAEVGAVTTREPASQRVGAAIGAWVSRNRPGRVQHRKQKRARYNAD